MFKQIFDLFNAVVIDGNQTREVFLDEAQHGFITDFVPHPDQRSFLLEQFKPLPITTLFTVKERAGASIEYLLSKQILHYVEVYGLGSPGLFDLETTSGQIATIGFVRGMTVDELALAVEKLLTANAPVKNAQDIRDIIDHYKLPYDIKTVANNELRIALFDVNNDVFDSGDDVVRWLCYAATGNPMLIKSKQTIDAIKEFAVPVGVLTRHENVLAEVFNRHKPLILAAKNRSTRTAINQISRLSKTRHVPLRQSPAKTFISDYLNGRAAPAFPPMTARDKFKMLNLLEYKKLQQTTDAFVIRNGKIHVERNRPLLPLDEINALQGVILNALVGDIKDLQGKKILLDPNVDYGLPISRKQTLGRLPFGTTVGVEGDTISSGIYWENSGGARDLDLSTIDVDGSRVGWGQYSGYSRTAPVTFSGDITSAPKGAMEFMTSDRALTSAYGLFVNIFCGEPGCKYKLVVGSKSGKHWIEDTVINEEATLDSKGNVIGFVRDGRFVVYAGRLNGSSISGSSKDTAIVSRATAHFWTIGDLLSALQIDFDLVRESGVDYDHDLSYKEFTFEKLEALFER